MYGEIFLKFPHSTNTTALIYKSRKEKPSETDSIKFKISSKTPRGKKEKAFLLLRAI